VNSKEYISSGIVESYVMGLASLEERTEFEANCAAYPEIAAARNAFELSLEKAAMENAIAPAKGLKEKIWNEIKQDDKKGKLISINKPAYEVNNFSWMKYAVAACLLLLAGSAYWNYSLYTSNIELKKERENYVARITDFEKEMKIISPNPSFKVASLKGLDPAPQALTTVYWDSTSTDVYLLVNNLPKPASDKQYQIWALLDGKPIDLGLIDNEFFVDQKRLLVKAKNVQKAQAFAITLEKKGGNGAKPAGAIYVLGNL
jgi:anti-sigma-K factor RskA